MAAGVLSLCSPVCPTLYHNLSMVSRQNSIHSAICRLCSRDSNIIKINKKLKI